MCVCVYAWSSMSLKGECCSIWTHLLVDVTPKIWLLSNIQHACMYVCMYVCMYLYVCMYVCMYICICMYVCMYVCVYVCMYMCVCMHVCMYVCMYVCRRCMVSLLTVQLAAFRQGLGSHSLISKGMLISQLRPVQSGLQTQT